MTWRFVPAAALMAILLTSLSTHAALHSRLGGQAYYDDQLDITWATNTNHISFGTWSSRVAGMSALVIDGVSGWRLPNMDVNGDGTVEGCSFGSGQAACSDNEFGHMHFYGAGTAWNNGIVPGNPGPFTSLTIFTYWSNTLLDSTTAYAFSMSNGLVGAADIGNIFGGWAVHDGDVNPSSIVDVTYDSPVIDFGPLSFGLTELPAAPEVTFSLNAGTPAGGGATSYGLGDVLSADIIFGDVIGPNHLTAFAMEVDAGGVTTALSYSFSPIDTATVQGPVILNFPFTVTGTDIASGQAFSYTYANSDVTITPVPIPEPTSLLLLAVCGVSLVGRCRARRLGGDEIHSV